MLRAVLPLSAESLRDLDRPSAERPEGRRGEGGWKGGRQIGPVTGFPRVRDTGCLLRQQMTAGASALLRAA